MIAGLGLVASVVLFFELGDFRSFGTHEAYAVVPAREMISSGNWVVPRSAGLPRLRKPPLSYWVVATSSTLFGEMNEWTVRVPAAVSALLLAVVIGVWAGRWYGRTAGLGAALVQLTSAWVIIYARKAEVDMHTSGGNIDFKDIIGSKIYGRTSGGNIDVTGIEGHVDVHTSGGNIEAMDIKGEFEGSASGGNIEFDRIMGHIDVNTSGGNIIGEHVVGRIIGKTSGGRIEIEKIWNRSFDDHEIYLKTSGGKIELRLPSDFPATIDATVINRRSTGAIDSEFPLQITLDDNDVLANGSINGGKFSVKLKTSHDSISIEKD